MRLIRYFIVLTACIRKATEWKFHQFSLVLSVEIDKYRNFEALQQKRFQCLTDSKIGEPRRAHVQPRASN